MKGFEAPDFCDLEALYTPEERAARQTVRDWVEARFLPVVEAHNRAGTFPMELVPEIAKLGVFGASFTGYGCAGMSNIAYGLVMQELERGDSGLRSFASVQGALCMYPILTFGTEAQRERWLPPMARGEKIGCFGLTEADFGSNPSGMRTRARQDGKNYVLNGTKMWITNGSIADVAVIWARIEDGPIRGFLVERGTPGLGASDIKGKFSMRASVTSELVLEDVRVPGDALLPGTEGLRSALMCLNQARYSIAWGAIGAAMACYDTALRYAGSRIVFDKPIAGYQLVQRKLVWMITEITKAQLLAYRLGRLKDEGTLKAEQISMGKMNNVDVALEIARMARDVLGANGILDEYPVARHLCNLETVKTYEGTHDIHTLVIGEAVTGHAAYR
ncbi:MAG: acyl-CoA dehydrogenase family protein [Myxococcota bacterium]